MTIQTLPTTATSTRSTGSPETGSGCPGRASAPQQDRLPRTRPAATAAENTDPTLPDTTDALTEALNPSGWPRPWLNTSLPEDLADHGDGRDRCEPYNLPAPWVVTVEPFLVEDTTSPDGMGIFPVARLAVPDRERERATVEDWRCQVCGTVVDDDAAYLPVIDDDRHAHGAGEEGYLASGGPCCSRRCARLAQTYCPHFAWYESSIIEFRRTDTRGYLDYGNWRLLVRAWTVLETRPPRSEEN